MKAQMLPNTHYSTKNQLFQELFKNIDKFFANFFLHLIIDKTALAEFSASEMGAYLYFFT